MIADGTLETFAKHQLTTEMKKSTWGLLWTKNLTGCLSIVTFNTKSGGVPGLTLGLKTPSWCECINVSSRSRTNTFFLTMLSRCLDIGDNGEMSYLMALCCWTCKYYQLLKWHKYFFEENNFNIKILTALTCFLKMYVMKLQTLATSNKHLLKLIWKVFHIGTDFGIRFATWLTILLVDKITDSVGFRLEMFGTIIKYSESILEIK